MPMLERELELEQMYQQKRGQEREQVYQQERRQEQGQGNLSLKRVVPAPAPVLFPLPHLPKRP